VNGDVMNGDVMNGDQVKYHQNEQSQILNLNILFYILNIYFYTLIIIRIKYKNQLK
jgi:hypothetical protein